MGSWIRFIHQDGDTTLFDAAQVFFIFNTARRRVEVFSLKAHDESSDHFQRICQFACEREDHLTAAEELIMHAVNHRQPLTLSAEVLDEHSEQLAHVHAMRMIIELLHHGQLRFPIENELSEQDLLGEAPDGGITEIREFEQVLHTYLQVPPDVLRRAIVENKPQDTPFCVQLDHESCQHHGFHEFWVVSSRPDRHYAVREQFRELAQNVCERENLHFKAQSLT